MVEMRMPEFEPYYLIAGCNIEIPLMPTVAPNPALAAENLGCRLANPQSDEPWVLETPEYLRNILYNVVMGAGGFDGEEIYYLVKVKKNSTEESIRLLLPSILTTAVLRNLVNYIRQEQLPP